MLGGSNGVGGGGIDDQAAEFGGSLQIDIVNSNTGTADDLQTALSSLEDLSGDFGATADDEGVAEGDLGAEVVGGQIVGAIDVGKGAEELEAGFSELLGDKNGGFGRGKD